MSTSSGQHNASSSSSKITSQLATTVVVALVAAVVAMKVTSRPTSADATAPQAVAERIEPVGKVMIKLEGGPLKTGEEVFKAQCSACHAAGLAGAPKFGDSAAWGPRIGAGYGALLNSALKGKGNMGPQGGGDFSELEIGRAVVYLANAGGAKLEEPKAGGAPAAAAAAAPAAAASN